MPKQAYGGGNPRSGGALKSSYTAASPSMSGGGGQCPPTPAAPIPQRKQLAGCQMPPTLKKP